MDKSPSSFRNPYFVTTERFLTICLMEKTDPYTLIFEQLNETALAAAELE